MESRRKAQGVHIEVHWSVAPRARTPLYKDFIPQQVYIHLKQGVGGTCEPVVAKGDRVRIGQPIGKVTEKVGSAVHASVSGVVKDIKDMPSTSGKPIPAVVIENDGDGRLFDDVGPTSRQLWPNPDEVVEAIRKAGVVGMGGAAFPSHKKLEIDGKKVDLCIINGAECEPLLRTDSVLMQVASEKILRGCRLVMHTVNASKAVIGVEDNKPEAIRCMDYAVRDHENITVARLPHLYPMGGEKQIIAQLAGREVPEGELPVKARVLVFNVATVAAIADAVDRSMPLVDRLCTVTGDVALPQVVRFPIGTLARDLISLCGGTVGRAARIIVGGPMMGVAIERPEVPLSKSANGVVVVNHEHDVHSRKEQPCIRCNRCVKVCPMFLMPHLIDRCQRKEDFKGCERYHATSCINCGCCTYVCPSSIPLAKNIVAAGKVLKEKKKEDKNA